MGRLLSQWCRQIRRQLSNFRAGRSARRAININEIARGIYGRGTRRRVSPPLGSLLGFYCHKRRHRRQGQGGCDWYIRFLPRPECALIAIAPRPKGGCCAGISGRAAATGLRRGYWLLVGEARQCPEGPGPGLLAYAMFDINPSPPSSHSGALPCPRRHLAQHHRCSCCCCCLLPGGCPRHGHPLHAPSGATHPCALTHWSAGGRLPGSIGWSQRYHLW